MDQSPGYGRIGPARVRRPVRVAGVLRGYGAWFPMGTVAVAGLLSHERDNVLKRITTLSRSWNLIRTLAERYVAFAGIARRAGPGEWAGGGRG